jgi:hypothetical protein
VFTFPKFEVDISRRFRVDQLSWPEPGDARNDGGLGCNRLYMDLRRMSWTDAKQVLADETTLIARITEASDPEEEVSVIDEEYDESGAELFGLDIGVASTVIALSAARCVPFSSCNGGVFGDRHNEAHPVVASYARPATANLLLEVAIEVDLGLESSAHGWLVLFSDDLRKFPKFADAMIRRRKEFNALRLSAPREPKPQPALTDFSQYELPLSLATVKSSADSERQSNSSYELKAWYPSERTREEMEKCMDLVGRGGAVYLRTMRRDLPRSLTVVIARHEGEIVGVGVIKPVREDYAAGIAAKSGYNLALDTPELGYVVVAPAHRGRGLSHKITALLLSLHEGRLFATTDSPMMKRALTDAGFLQAGKEWQGRRGLLSLWERKE